jgi:hypothetical protein
MDYSMFEQSFKSSDYVNDIGNSFGFYEFPLFFNFRL